MWGFLLRHDVLHFGLFPDGWVDEIIRSYYILLKVENI